VPTVERRHDPDAPGAGARLEPRREIHHRDPAVRLLTTSLAPGKMTEFPFAADDSGEELLVRTKRALVLLVALALVGAGVAALSGLAGAGVAGIQGSGKGAAVAGIQGTGK